MSDSAAEIQAWYDLESRTLSLVGSRNYQRPGDPHASDTIDYEEDGVLEAAKALVAVREPAAGASWMHQVEQFASATGQPLAQRCLGPEQVPTEVATTRNRLIIKQVEKWVRAQEETDVVAMLDAGTDLLYATIGTLLTFFPANVVQEAFSTVHAANMTKIPSAGGVPERGEDGIFLKGDRYEPPTTTLATLIVDNQ